jgi:very-short-patch-repair endonuclease
VASVVRGWKEQAVASPSKHAFYRCAETHMNEPTPPDYKKHKTLGAPDRTIRIARKLRQQMSPPEVLLWQQLRHHPGRFQFRRQHPIGPYILDFACVRARLAIEVDGESHNRGDQAKRDENRDAWVLKQGFVTLRFPAQDVLKNMNGVVMAIVAACKERARPNPLRVGVYD